jgi:hypothetical protein
MCSLLMPRFNLFEVNLNGLIKRKCEALRIGALAVLSRHGNIVSSWCISTVRCATEGSSAIGEGYAFR